MYSAPPNRRPGVDPHEPAHTVYSFCWSDTEYSPKELEQTLRRRVPFLVMTTRGYLGRDEWTNAVGADEMFWVREILMQPRIVVRSEKGGCYYSIPLSYPEKVLPQSCDPTTEKPMTIKEFLDQGDEEGGFYFAVEKSKQNVFKGPNSRQSIDFGNVRIIDQYQEKYLLVHPLTKGCLRQEACIIPLYMPISLVVAMASTDDVQETFYKTMIDMKQFADSVPKSSALPRDLKEASDILMYEGKPAESEYDLLEPLQYVSLQKPSGESRSSALYTTLLSVDTTKDATVKEKPSRSHPRLNFHLSNLNTAFKKLWRPYSSKSSTSVEHLDSTKDPGIEVPADGDRNFGGTRGPNTNITLLGARGYHLSARDPKEVLSELQDVFRYGIPSGDDDVYTALDRQTEEHNAKNVVADDEEMSETVTGHIGQSHYANVGYKDPVKPSQQESSFSAQANVYIPDPTFTVRKPKTPVNTRKETKQTDASTVSSDMAMYQNQERIRAHMPTKAQPPPPSPKPNKHIVTSTATKAQPQPQSPKLSKPTDSVVSEFQRILAARAAGLPITSATQSSASCKTDQQENLSAKRTGKETISPGHLSKKTVIASGKTDAHETIGVSTKNPFNGKPEIKTGNPETDDPVYANFSVVESYESTLKDNSDSAKTSDLTSAEKDISTSGESKGNSHSAKTTLTNRSSPNVGTHEQGDWNTHGQTKMTSSRAQSKPQLSQKPISTTKPTEFPPKSKKPLLTGNQHATLKTTGIKKPPTTGTTTPETSTAATRTKSPIKTAVSKATPAKTAAPTTNATKEASAKTTTAKTKTIATAAATASKASVTAPTVAAAFATPQPAASAAQDISIESLTVEEVGETLENLNLGKYKRRFEEEQIDGSLLAEMDMDILHNSLDMDKLAALKLWKFAKSGWLPQSNRP